MKQWNETFKKYGKVFTEPQEDVEKIAKIFKKHGVRRVLDLGCGTGRHLVYFAQKGFDIYGYDIAEEGIKIAKGWLKEEKLKARFKIGSIYKKLPYSDDFFDAVISTNTIHHARIKKIRKAVKEIERVLKPGGLIFITVRRRVFKELIPGLTIVESYKDRITRHKIIAPRTYLPISGGEKGLPHYLFSKELIKKEFKKFEINIWIDSVGRHYCFLGKLKS